MLISQAGHDRGHRVLEDTVLVLKELKRGIYVTPTMDVMQHTKKRLWGSEAREMWAFLRRASPCCKSHPGAGRSKGSSS